MGKKNPTGGGEKLSSIKVSFKHNWTFLDEEQSGLFPVYQDTENQSIYLAHFDDLEPL